MCETHRSAAITATVCSIHEFQPNPSSRFSLPLWGHWFKSLYMTASSAKKAANPSPLDQLGFLLAEDMNAVNAMIIARMNSRVPMIPQLAGYLIAAGGKRIRPLMTLAATAIQGGDMIRAHRLATAVEFIHSATLLHDDVVDDSEERRGQQSANAVFGNEASVLVGDFLFSRAFQLMTEDGSLDVLKILSDASAVIAEGEILQLSLQGNIDASMQDYLDVIHGKTAALFAAACEVGPVVAGTSEEQRRAMYEYGLNLGMAFQIIDDILDYAADQTVLGKTIGDDFREGKMSAPVIMALQKANTDEKQFWERTIAQRNQRPDDFNHALSLCRQHLIFEDGMALAISYGDKAKQALSLAPTSPVRDALSALVDFTLQRDY